MPSSVREAPASRRVQAARGLGFTVVAQAWRVLLGLTSGVLLARLLAPSDFGLVAMAMTAMSLAVVLQDAGLNQATVQAERLEDGHVSALFWTTAGVSALVALLLAVSGPAIAAFYREPRVTALVAGFAGVLLLYGLQSQHMALLNRELRFKALAGLDAVAAGVGFAVGLATALAFRTYWALFLATLASALVTLAGSWILCRWRPSRPHFGGGLGSMLRFGAGVSGFQVMNFVSRNADNVLIGRVLGQSALGFYDRAYRLLLFPIQQVTIPMQKVMVPLLSRLRNEPEKYREAYCACVSLILALVQPGLVVLILHAPAVFTLLLGERWLPAAPIFAWLGVAGLHQPMMATLAWLFLSQGRGGDFFKYGLVTTVVTVAAFAIGLRWGAVGVAAAYAAAEYLKLPFTFWWAGRRGEVGQGELYRTAGPHWAGVAASAAAVLAWPSAAAFGWGDAALAVVLSYAAYLLVLVAFKAKRRLALEGLSLALSTVRGSLAKQTAQFTT
ncbi:lipopolysaccharide biosynthesis protein [Phenylobacterium deserti]|uniref:Lipopolysaccharide biosynthesis protein n=1 Tax=Phenylobacterium deserti TaxID=1914756 RepID=A0A328ATX3_9CAUL|nr:lipopolysaccharide biosynthesis protein [Phenylobacterium deserti]RAK56964.1 lipopolysaccharide biosynthesis protein [Phenylobacterium deserti]